MNKLLTLILAICLISSSEIKVSYPLMLGYAVIPMNGTIIIPEGVWNITNIEVIPYECDSDGRTIYTLKKIIP